MNLLIVLASGPLLLSVPQTVQFCNGAEFDASQLISSREVMVREYDPARNSCWAEVREYYEARKQIPCKPGETTEEWDNLLWSCWTASSKNLTSEQDYSSDVHEHFDYDVLSFTFPLEVGRHYMAIVRQVTYDHDFDWGTETDPATNIDESQVHLNSWSFIVGKMIVAGGELTYPKPVRIRVERR